jgi:hypothetical protein
MSKLLRSLLAAVVLAAIAAGMTGCATDEADNLSEKPWNSPGDFGGNGMLPSTINEGR